MGSNPTSVNVRIAATAHVVADHILAADFAQTVMILITAAAATTYGWIEGYVIRENISNGSRSFSRFGHFSSYQIAVGLLLGLITGGFALIKSRNMFAKGNRYFLFAVVGNYPFSWLVEDFTYFLFNPLDVISAHAWDVWFLGGIYVYNPWLPGAPKPEFFIPTWYFLAFAWFIGCQWYAHRCTVYDATIKDELGHQILPEILPKPLPKKDEHVKESPRPTRVPTKLPQVEPTPTKKTPLKAIPKTVESSPKSRVRSEDAEQALKRLRTRWVRDDAN